MIISRVNALENACPGRGIKYQFYDKFEDNISNIFI
jgi:hypothetical protein